MRSFHNIDQIRLIGDGFISKILLQKSLKTATYNGARAERFCVNNENYNNMQENVESTIFLEISCFKINKVSP
jgi:hypothetical protein